MGPEGRGGVTVKGLSGAFTAVLPPPGDALLWLPLVIAVAVEEVVVAFSVGWEKDRLLFFFFYSVCVCRAQRVSMVGIRMRQMKAAGVSSGFGPGRCL